MKDIEFHQACRATENSLGRLLTCRDIDCLSQEYYSGKFVTEALPLIIDDMTSRSKEFREQGKQTSQLNKYIMSLCERLDEELKENGLSPLEVSLHIDY